MWLMAAALLWTTAVGLWLGVDDVLWPVSLAAELLGLLFLLAGLAGGAGLVGLAGLLPGLAGRFPGRKLSPGPWNRSGRPTWQTAAVFGGSIAGCYIDATITRYSAGYRAQTTCIFVVLALLCFCLACVMLPAMIATWKDMARSLKGLGLSAALLALVAQFWYVGVYAPANTPAGIDYTIAIGPVVASKPTAQNGAEKIVQVNVTMEDEGSVAALTLGSILVVSGMSYPDGNPTTLRVLQPVNDDSFLFPDDPVSYDFTVVITQPGIDALVFALTVDFARTSWLTLGYRRASTTEYSSMGCRKNKYDTRTEWYVVESYLHRFAQGPQVLYSDYCRYPVQKKGPTAPFVSVGIDGVRGRKLVSIPNPSPAGSDLGILQSTRNETLLLG